MTDTPKIRFKGFADDWEQRKFCDVTEIKSASRVHKEEWTASGVPFFRSSDVMAVINGTENERAYISEELYEKLSSISGKLEKGDVLVTGGGSVGNPYIVPNNEPLYTKDADLLWVKHCDELDTFFVYEYFFSPLLRNYLSSISHVGTIAHYTITQLENTPISLPSVAEQKKIGRYFAALDYLIILHQRKCDETKEFKKFMLQKMFPRNGKEMPEIRFAGFTDAWEQRKLGDAFDLSVPNNTLSRAELNYDKGEVKSVHYGDVLVKYGAVIDAQEDEIPYITDRKATDFLVQRLLEGDIIFADTAEDETTGKAAEIRHLGDAPIVSGLHTIVCRPIEKMAPYYLGYYLNSESYHRQLLPLMQGIKVLSLSKTNLTKTVIAYPSTVEEQRQIGAYFYALDHLITLHRRKCDELKEVKKFMLQNMFP